MAELSHIHRFVPARSGAGHPPLLLLHGTGGNEDDLLALGSRLAPGAALLSPRGQILENGMPRFFRRLTEGVFDETDLRLRTQALAGFIAEAQAAYGLAAPIAVGFSNGANIAASLLLTHPGVLAGAILLRAMPPFRAPPEADLGNVPVLLLSGLDDPIAPPAVAERLAESLEARGAALTHEAMPAGHNLTQADLSRMESWLKSVQPAS
ncbi:MAG: hydrolase [Mesorhizobium amorphae]|nr:MAG: hydrolase [Mesorhizobium amorphae]